jgi:hypothetical protein
VLSRDHVSSLYPSTLRTTRTGSRFCPFPGIETHASALAKRRCIGMMAPHSGEAALRSSGTFLAQSSQELLLFFWLDPFHLSSTNFHLHPSVKHPYPHLFSSPPPTLDTSAHHEDHRHPHRRCRPRCRCACRSQPQGCCHRCSDQWWSGW